MNRKLKIFLTAVLFFSGLALVISSKGVFSATDTLQWEKYKEDLTQEGLTSHHVNDAIFKFNDVLFEEDFVPENDVTTYKGALPFLSQAIGTVYENPPASAIYYASNILQSLGGKAAYAQNQGFGFDRLGPILHIWKAFRNVTYVLFTLIFVVVGLAIMLRVKISPQAVITIENAIPKIIGSLILVTFSYAIAGFMIDLMNVIMALGISILTSQGIQPSLIQIFGWAPPIPAAQVGPQKVMNWGFYSLTAMFFAPKRGLMLIGRIIGAMIGVLTLNPLAGIAGSLLVGPSLVKLIWSVIALVLMFKLFFALIKAYINILISVILSPFQIMLGAIPGLQAGGFGKWLKGIFTELMIFPAVAIIAIIGNYILQKVNLGNLWVAPLIGPPELNLAPDWFPEFGISGRISSVFTQTIIGMGFLIILAKIPDIIRQAMKTETGYGAAVGEALAPIGMGAAAIGSARAMQVEKTFKDQLNDRKVNLKGRTVAERSLWQVISNATGGKVRS